MTVYVADTSTERRQGLRDIEELPAGVDGMLFVYSAPTKVSFGMLNTPMPLDVWWFDANGSLVGSNQMEPCAAVPCPDYLSPGPIMWVVETPQGAQRFLVGSTISNVGS